MQLPENLPLPSPLDTTAQQWQNSRLDHLLARCRLDTTAFRPLADITILDVGCGGGLLSEVSLSFPVAVCIHS